MDIKYAPEVVLALREAGKMMLTKAFTEVKDKGNIANLVTDMDIKVQEFLVNALATIIPDSSFLAEEDEKHEEHDGFMWVIDPIDGTTNYIYDYHHSAISVALVKDHEAVLGAVYDPYLDEMFLAEKGNGAYLNGQPMRVSKNGLAASLVMCGTTPYDKAYAQVTFDVMRRMFMAGKDIRRSGSAVLDLCYVACGRVDGFFEQRLAPWDFAAGALMILEAGGRIMPLDGTIQYSRKIGMIAGNANNIEDLIEITGRDPKHVLVGTCHGTKPLDMFQEEPQPQSNQDITKGQELKDTVETMKDLQPKVEEIENTEETSKDAAPIQEQPEPKETTEVIDLQPPFKTPSSETESSKIPQPEEMTVQDEQAMELLHDSVGTVEEKKTDVTVDSMLEDLVQEEKDNK